MGTTKSPPPVPDTPDYDPAAPRVLTFAGRDIPLPQSWNDLGLRDLVRAYVTLMRDADPALAAAEVVPSRRIELLQQLAGLSPAQLRTWEEVRREEHNGDGTHFLAELQEVADFASDPFLATEERADGTRRTSIRLSLTRNPYPSLRYKSKRGPKTLYGPADELENVTLYELIHLFTALEAYLEDGDQAHVSTALAIAWRPGKPTSREQRALAYQGDRRLPFRISEATVPGRARRMEKLEPTARRLLLFFLLSCRHQIIENFPNLFQSRGQQVERVGNDYRWAGVLLSLAGGLDKLEATGDQNWNDAFIYMSYLEDQRKLAEINRKS